MTNKIKAWDLAAQAVEYAEGAHSLYIYARVSPHVTIPEAYTLELVHTPSSKRLFITINTANAGLSSTQIPDAIDGFNKFVKGDTYT